MITNRIQQLLTDSNISMETLARGTHTHRNTISKIIRTGQCRIDTAVRIAHFFNCTVEEVFQYHPNGDGNKQGTPGAASS